MSTDLAVSQEVMRRGVELAKTIQARRATSEEIAEFKRLLPHTWRSFADLTAANENKLISIVTTNKPENAHKRLAIGENVRQVKAGLGYEQSSMMERLIIDQVALAWLRVQVADFLASHATEQSQQAHFDRRANVAQGRFLRSCTTLAKIRKIMTQTPALQINIAQNQVNTV